MAIPLNFSNPFQSKLDTSSIDMTSTAQQIIDKQNESNDQKPEIDPKVKKRNDEFRQRIDACKTYRRKLIKNWTVSVDYRRGKPFTSQTDDDRVSVNLDWMMTKAKQAALFSQVPQVRISHSPESLPKTSPWTPQFERKLNDTLVEAGIEAAMDECLPDCINAAGIGAVLVCYEAITEDRQVPSIDLSKLPPEIMSQVLQSGQFNGKPILMETVPYTVDHRYITQRISPADLLWPINFTGSNFNNSPWIGRSGRITWADAVIKFKLKEEDKDKVLGEDRPMLDKITHDAERDKISADEMVSFDEIFYKEFQYDPDAKSYSTIHHLVFVNGKEVPVIDRPWEGQRVEEDGTIVGALKYAIQTLTLAYLTDETIPPSDSAIGRPQVNEINKARSQMIRQRERSLPIRWYNVDRVDPAIQQGLMRGTWQAMIPVQGDGTRVIGEVTRATMPPENFLFDKIAKADFAEICTLGPTGQQIEEAKGDSNQNLASFNTQAGRERAKVASFIVNIAEVLGGLMCLYEDPAIFGEGFDPHINKVLNYGVLADSTVLLDAGQKLARINQFVEKYAKSGWVNLEPVLQEVAVLTGLDPTVAIKAPEPRPPVEPNISLRLTGVEDLLNPLTLAFLMKSGQAPDAALIEQAKQLIQQAVVPPAGMQMPSEVQPMGGLPMLPGSGSMGTQEAGPPLPPPVPAPPPGTPVPQPPPPAIGAANPQWTTLPSLEKKVE